MDKLTQEITQMNRFYKYVVVLVLVLMVGECRVLAADNSAGKTENSKVKKLPVTTSMEKETTAAEKKDGDRVLVTVNDVSLKGWQVDAMMKYGASRKFLDAINLWVDIQAKLAEARRRQLDKGRDAQFILNLYKDYYLSGRLLVNELDKEIPRPTEEQARKKYEENIDRYNRPFKATVRHITFQKRSQAQKAVDEAKEKDADFEKLYEKYTKQQDEFKGLIENMSVEKLKVKLGEECAAAVQSAKRDDVLGPFVGVQGFEVIKVTSISPAYFIEFNKAKPGILGQMSRQMKTDVQKKIFDEIKAKVEVVKSEEIIELEKQAEKAKNAPKGRGVRSGPGPGRPR